MEKTQHTPGPWTICKVEQPFVMMEIYNESGRTVCQFEKTENASTIERHEKEACLIAAAPDLLEVLKNLFAYSENSEYFIDSKH